MTILKLWPQFFPIINSFFLRRSAVRFNALFNQTSIPNKQWAHQKHFILAIELSIILE